MSGVWGRKERLGAGGALESGMKRVGVSWGPARAHQGQRSDQGRAECRVPGDVASLARLQQRAEPLPGGRGVWVGVGSRGEEQSHARRLRERSWQPGRRLVYFFMEVNNPVAFQRGAWPPPPVPGECHGPMQPLPPDAAAHGPRAASRQWPCTLWAPGHGALASGGPLASWP